MLRSLAFTAVVAASAFVTAGDTITGPVNFTDGDTIRVLGHPVRLSGIDAPELRQLCGKDWRCGVAAAREARSRFNGKVAVCVIETHDRYRRAVASCAIDGEDIGSWLVRSGWALAYRRYSNRYVLEEATARRDRAGIWSSTFEAPWDWRQ